jgi:holliday junction DNA helicase RuvA
MIASVRGYVIATTPESVVVDVAGIGYRCLVPGSTRNRLPAVGHEVLLYTSLQVREDSLTLFGFLTSEEFNLFELLLRVDGIGPKVALGVLSATTSDGFRRAVAFDDITALCRIPGIGKKTAQRMVLELKDKIGHVGGPAENSAGVGAIALIEAEPDAALEAIEALTALGYAHVDAATAMEKARHEAGETATVELLVRLGLKHLFRG